MTTSLLITALTLIGLWLGIDWLRIVWTSHRSRVALEGSKPHEELFADFNQMESDLAASTLEFKNAKRDFRQALKKQRPPKSELTTRSISKTQTILRTQSSQSTQAIPTSQSSTPTIPTSIEPTSNPNPKRKRGISTPPKVQTPAAFKAPQTPTPTPPFDTPSVISPPTQIIREHPCPSVAEFNQPPKRNVATLVLIAIIQPIAAISRWCINFFSRRTPPAASSHSDVRKAA